VNGEDEMTKKQVEVAKLLAEGKTYPEIEKKTGAGRGFISYIRHRDLGRIRAKVRLMDEFITYAELFR
jgi:uncharacterized protein YerC